MKKAFSLVLVHLFVFATIQAQSPTATTDAANSVQVSQPLAPISQPSPARHSKAKTPVILSGRYLKTSRDV